MTALFQQQRGCLHAELMNGFSFLTLSYQKKKKKEPLKEVLWTKMLTKQSTLM